MGWKQGAQAEKKNIQEKERESALSLLGVVRYLNAFTLEPEGAKG